MAQLTIILSDGRSRTHTLSSGAAEAAGRDPACEIWIDDPGTSRRHARFRKTPEGFAVEDLGSKNGTLVNDAPCAARILRDGDVITLGTVQLTYQDDDSSAEPPTVVVTDRPADRQSARYSNPGDRVQLPQQRLQVIYELSDRLTRLRDRDQLLSDAMDICFDMLRFERGAIAVRRPGGRTVDWPVVRHLRGKEGELTISRTTLSRALDHGERAIVTEDRFGNADPTVSMVQHGIRSAMCVPLMYDNNVLGVIYGDRISTAAVYTPEDVDFLAAIARQVSIGLVNARLLDEQRQMARLEKDLELARRIQNGLLPAALPARPGLKVAALNEPGNRVSGDYYDVIERPDGRLWMLVADVTGEGVAAALLMANLQAAVRATIDETDDPAELMTRWNRLICANTDSSKFITALLGLIDPAARRARFTAAGHFPPLIVRSLAEPQASACASALAEPSYKHEGAAEPQASACASADSPTPLPPFRGVTSAPLQADFPLGVFDDARYQTVEVDLGPAPCTVFSYTDGVIEARDRSDALFGHPRLAAVLAERAADPPGAMLTAVRKAVTRFIDGAPQSDDITMLAVTLEASQREAADEHG